MAKELKIKSYDIYLKNYKEHLYNTGEDPRSISERVSVIKKFFNFLSSHVDSPKFSDIQKIDIMNFLDESEGEGLKGKTLKRYFSFLKKFFSYYHKEGVNINGIFDHWKYSPDDESSSIFLTDDQIKYIYSLIISSQDIEQSKIVELIFILLVYTGCTKTELCTMNVYENNSNLIDTSNYILLSENIIVLGKKQKTSKTKQRVLPLGPKIISVIKSYIDYMKKEKGVDFQKYPYLFVSNYGLDSSNFERLSSSQITNELKSLINSCDSTIDKKTSFQVFRNTFIKKLVKENVPLQTIKSLTGLDYSSFKRYIGNIEEYEKKQIAELLVYNHPFKYIFDK